MTTREIRIQTAKPELRDNDGVKTAVGYCALYGSRTAIGDWFTEEIRAGAFAKTLKEDDQRALVDHDTGRVIGRRSSGTLRISEDKKGVKVEIDLPDTTDGRDLAVLLERGDISGMSFAMRVTKQEWDESEDIPHRTITEAVMYEASAVAFPAYPETELGLRSEGSAALEGLETFREARKKADNHANATKRLKRKARQDHLERRL